MGLFNFIKDIIGNTQSEEVTKATSFTNGDGTKRTTQKRGITTNDAPKPDGTKHSISSTNSTQQPKGVDKVNTLPPGFNEAWQANQLWDKGKKTDAVKLYEQSLSQGFNNDDKPFFHLGCYYMERKDWNNLKRILAVTPNYMHRQRWYVDGKRLMEEAIGKMPNGWINIERAKTANAETWQEQYERMTTTFPQFDFDGKYEDEIREEDVEALDDFTKGLKRKLRQAQNLIAWKDYRAAAELLAEFVRNGYWKPEPYDMLMDIYHVAGLETERKRLAEHAITHFSQLRDAQRDKILRYATAQDCRDKIEEYIDDGNPIYYGDGLFAMYSPYPETEKWQKLIDG